MNRYEVLTRGVRLDDADITSETDFKNFAFIQAVKTSDNTVTDILKSVCDSLDTVLFELYSKEITLTFNLSDFSKTNNKLKLPFRNITNLSSVKIYDSNNNETTISAIEYSNFIGSKLPYIQITEDKYYNGYSKIVVTLTAGWTASTIPSNVKTYIYNRAMLTYKNRGNPQPLKVTREMSEMIWRYKNVY